MVWGQIETDKWEDILTYKTIDVSDHVMTSNKISESETQGNNLIVDTLLTSEIITLVRRIAVGTVATH